MTQINFYELGKQYADEIKTNVFKKANEIEKNYGHEEKIIFIAGLFEGLNNLIAQENTNYNLTETEKMHIIKEGSIKGKKL